MAHYSKSDHSGAILPGATLGILGSGQLGRMFAQAAARLGYRVHVYSPLADSPTEQVADQATVAEYDDIDELTKFANAIEVVTLEFENVPTTAVETLSQHVPVRPSGKVQFVVQNRLREKLFLQQTGIACAPFAEVTTAEQLADAVDKIGLPAVLKTAESGYDGKGQSKITTPAEASTAWTSVDQVPAVLEGWVAFQRELSILVARSPSGQVAIHGPLANDHVNHILDVSLFPLAELDPILDEAQQIGRKIVEALDLVGICCIEFFLTVDGQLLVNEIAPRPHNSGHLTIDACLTSQFEQQVRAICDLPLGSGESVVPAAMVNLLGELWEQGEPNWQAVLSDPQVHLHLYGKADPRAGRKMGHLTVLAGTVEEAAQRALAAREQLTAS
ncbi:MAG TPA: 5-(carboxyamino)imidazole ribonucleotide synthase [Planctomycetaceae bacterium]|nr:5-(carboxyamino)imidazole ribonucleotide synthase [Planctomycetaceae bacterium]